MTLENYGEWVISFHIPKKCFNFKSLKDPDFRKFWNLKKERLDKILVDLGFFENKSNVITYNIPL